MKEEGLTEAKEMPLAKKEEERSELRSLQTLT